jgi:hypothetical protein
VLREFAIDPALVARWTGIVEYRYVVSQFGLGQPRIAAEFPKTKNWRRQALAAMSGMDPIAAQRLEALVRMLTTRMAPRAQATYDGTRSWLDNACNEHRARAFAAVLAVAPISDLPDVVDGTLPTLLGFDCWNCTRTAIVPRTAAAIADVAAPLLRAAHEVVLVDPYFQATRPGHRNVLSALLRVVASTGRASRIEVHASADFDMSPSSAQYERDCRTHLSGLASPQLGMRIVRWSSQTNDQVLHNRYVLTDVGSLAFGHGLDEGAPGETDDVTLLEAEHHRTRWEQYHGASPAFRLVDDFEL